MSKIRLFGTSSGYVEIAPAAAASNNTLTAPSTVGEIIAKDAAGAIGITSMKASNVNVGAAVTITESGIEASGIGITCANINGTQIGGRRNIMINGDMQVAQRATTSTTNGYGSLDRFRLMFNGTDENPTQAQHALSTSDTPYSLGFRYSFHITNGNQTSGAGATDYIQLLTTIEAQDIARSGWNYTSSSSFITLSFWVKSSVAQNFYGAVRTQDGTVRSFPFETGSLTADTWKKVIIKIPGDSSNTFNNDSGSGLQIFMWAFRGTDYSGSVTLNQWNTWNTSTGTPDYTTTWYTTNDATLEFTGFQLEVGPEATAFEHRSFAEELRLCQRYYYQNTSYGTVAQTNSGETINTAGFSGITMYSATSGRSPFIYHPVMMRATPTTTFYSASNAAGGAANLLSIYSSGTNWDNVASNTTNASSFHVGFKITTNDNFTAGYTYLMGGQFSCDAEI